MAQSAQTGRAKRGWKGTITRRGAATVGRCRSAIVAESLANTGDVHPRGTSDRDARWRNHFHYVGTSGLRAASTHSREGEERGRYGSADSHEPRSLRGVLRSFRMVHQTIRASGAVAYLFPFRKPTPNDPTKPITDVTGAWKALRKSAGVQCRLHDLRHTAATKTAEAGVPESTMLAIMGHMSRAMLERYSHIRMAAKRPAMDSLMLNRVQAPVEAPKEADADGAATTLNPGSIQLVTN